MAVESVTSTASEAVKRKRFRVPRSCDRCRKSKIKCVFEADRCNACLGAGTECTFANPGSLKERAPTLKDIEHLNARIRSLERLLVAAKPDIDLGHAIGQFEPTLQQDGTPSSADSPYSDVTNGASEWSGGDLISVHDAFERFTLDDDEDTLHTASFDVPDPASDILHPTSAAPETDKIMAQWRDWKIKAFSDPVWPAPDLEKSLITIYFRDAHPVVPVLHPKSFFESHSAGLQSSNLTFRALCLAVFAMASHFSTDPRVLKTEADTAPAERPASGWHFARAAHQIVWGFCHPPDLYELQAWCLLTHHITNSGSPMLGWSFCGQGLHRAGAIGVHREKSKRWTNDPLQDFLRRRVFFELFFRECMYSNALGRAPMMKSADFDLQPADPALDQLYGTFDTPFSTESIFLPSDSLQTITMWHQLVWHPHSVGMTLAKTFFDWSTPGKMRRAQILEAAKKLERDVCMRLEAWTRSLPDTIKWREDACDGTLVLASRLATQPHYYRLVIYRRLHTFDPTDLASLGKCADEAEEIIKICSVLRRRNLLHYNAHWATFAVTSAGIMTMYTLGKKGVPSTEGMITFVRRVDEVLSCLWALSDVNCIAKKAHSSITKYLSWTSHRHEAELAKARHVSPTEGDEVVYRMCSSLAQALSTRTLQQAMEARSHSASASPQTQSASTPSSSTSATPNGSIPIERPQRASPAAAPLPSAMLAEVHSTSTLGPDPMFLDFNPLAFEMTSLLSPSEVWTASNSGQSVEPFIAENSRWNAPTTISQNGASQAPTFARPPTPAPSPPDSWQALMAVLDPNAPQAATQVNGGSTSLFGTGMPSAFGAEGWDFGSMQSRQSNDFSELLRQTAAQTSGAPPAYHPDAFLPAL